jgi:hypothetical protein
MPGVGWRSLLTFEVESACIYVTPRAQKLATLRLRACGARSCDSLRPARARQVDLHAFA